MKIFEEYFTRFDRRLDWSLTSEKPILDKIEDVFDVGCLYFYLTLMVFMYYVTIGAGFAAGVYFVYLVIR